MSYSLVPLNSATIYPFQRHSYMETVVRNMTSSEKFFGFLGAHGKRLKAFGDSGGADIYSVPGNLEEYLKGIPGHRYKRMFDHYLNALANKLIRTTVNRRVVYYAPVADATAFNVGDLLWWDDTAKLAKPASSFTWTTNLQTTQINFAQKCLGVSLDKKGASNGTVILRVDLSPRSFWDFAIAAGTAYHIGQTFGPAKDTGNALLSNKLAPAIKAASVARLIADMTNTDTNVLVSIASAYNVEELPLEGAQSGGLFGVVEEADEFGFEDDK